MSRDDCGADCGVCDVCEVSAPETPTNREVMLLKMRDLEQRRAR